MIFKRAKGAIFVLLLISCILPFQLHTIENYKDTVNIRKAFFFHETAWSPYINKVIKKTDGDNNIGFICKFRNNHYEMLFYIADNGWKDVYSNGRISYQFDCDKNLVKAKVYYQNGKGSYLYFHKDNPGKLDIYLFGKPYIKDVPYYFPMDSLKYLTLQAIFKQLKRYKYDKKILITKSDKDLKEKLIEKIFKPSTGMNFMEDGARDKFGKFVYIENGNAQPAGEEGVNCSGYVKEIADNYIRSYKPAFKYLDIDELKSRRLFERENLSYKQHEYEYDPFFGLDWVKNVTDAINDHCNLSIIKAEDLTGDSHYNAQRYYGYNVSEMKEVIFRDQMRDSTYFYILAFNNIRTKPPIISRFYHIAMVVPYFDDHTIYFRVFESGEETSYENLLKYHSTGKVVIMKVPIPIPKL